MAARYKLLIEIRGRKGPIKVYGTAIAIRDLYDYLEFQEDVLNLTEYNGSGMVNRSWRR